MKKGDKKPKDLTKFLPLLFVLMMIGFLITNHETVSLSPSQEDIGIQTTKGVSTFALFVSISFIASLIIIFIVYYVLVRQYENETGKF